MRPSEQLSWSGLSCQPAALPQLPCDINVRVGRKGLNAKVFLTDEVSQLCSDFFNSAASQQIVPVCLDIQARAAAGERRREREREREKAHLRSHLIIFLHFPRLAANIAHQAPLLKNPKLLPFTSQYVSGSICLSYFV